MTMPVKNVLFTLKLEWEHIKLWSDLRFGTEVRFYMSSSIAFNIMGVSLISIDRT